MRTRFLLLAVALSACFDGSDLGECIGNAIGQAIGNSLVISSREKGKDPARADEAVRLSAETWLSVQHEGGRLGLDFAGPPLTEDLPRLDAGCLLVDFAYFLPADWPDGGPLSSVKAHVAVVESTATDAGTRLVLEVTALTANLPDGGTRALADRHIDVLAK